MSETTKCPLCAKPASFKEEFQTDAQKYKCSTCGPFSISNEVLLYINGGSAPPDLHLLSGYTREASDRRQPPPHFTTENIAALIRSQPDSIADRSQKLLRAIERRSKYFGDTVDLKLETDFPLSYARSPAEFRTFLKLLSERRLIECNTNAFSVGIVLRSEGFDELSRQSGVDSETAFVAMWFHESMTPVFTDVIEPTIRECGYRAVRVDYEQFNDDIVAKIMAEIRLSRFVVADFTGHRNGVYFEAGFGLGLGIPVIFACRQDHADDAHFDTQHFNHVRWADNAELRIKLRDRIIGTIGPGPLATGNKRRG